MGKLEYTFYINTIFFLRDYLLIPVAITIIILILLVFKDYMLRIKEKIVTIRIKKHISFCTFMLYYLILFQSTVFSRLKHPQNPLADIWGGWVITEGKYFHDLSVIWNIIIFLPICFSLYILLKGIFKQKIKNKELFKYSILLSFATTILIELMQILLNAGTFQFADIFYNTLGGILGSLIFLLIKTKLKKLNLNHYLQ